MVVTRIRSPTTDLDDDQLARDAIRVLIENWHGHATVPSRRLYPHQWSWDSACIAIGYAVLRGLETINLQDLPRASEIRLDAVVTASTFAVAAIIGLVLGMIPVAAALRATPLGIPREAGRSHNTRHEADCFIAAQ